MKGELPMIKLLDRTKEHAPIRLQEQLLRPYTISALFKQHTTAAAVLPIPTNYHYIEAVRPTPVFGMTRSGLGNPSCARERHTKTGIDAEGHRLLAEQLEAKKVEELLANGGLRNEDLTDHLVGIVLIVRAALLAGEPSEVNRGELEGFERRCGTYCKQSSPQACCELTVKQPHTLIPSPAAQTALPHSG